MEEGEAVGADDFTLVDLDFDGEDVTLLSGSSVNASDNFLGGGCGTGGKCCASRGVWRLVCLSGEDIAGNNGTCFRLNLLLAVALGGEAMKWGR